MDNFNSADQLEKQANDDDDVQLIDEKEEEPRDDEGTIVKVSDNHDDSITLNIQKDDDHHVPSWKNRLKSLAEKLLNMIVVFVPLGLFSFGGPIAHISLLEKQFVRKKKWIDEPHFTELFSLSQSLPGPTSTQMVIAVGTIYLNSIFGGILAFVLFSFPSFIVMTLVGLFLSDQNITSSFHPLVFVMLNGFSCAAVALVVQAAWQLSRKLSDSLFGKSLLLFACITFLLIPLPWILVVLMVLGGILTLVKFYLEKLIDNRLKNYITETEEEKLETLKKLLKEKEQEEGIFNFTSSLIKVKTILLKTKIFFSSFRRSPRQFSNTIQSGSQSDNETSGRQQTPITTFKPWMGILFLGLFFVILGGLMIGRIFFEFKYLIWFEAFYRIGCMIFGGGHVVLGMIVTEFTDYITEQEFLNGFSLVSCLPGPMFNIAAYVGAVISKSIVGAFLCWIALFLPAFLLIWGILPFWSKYREKEIVQKILFGINSVAIGFVYTAIFLLWKGSVHNNNLYSAATVVLSFTLLCVYDWSAPIVILTGGGTRVALHEIFESNINNGTNTTLHSF
ncbi:hypothetical protein C9374_012408 [Naegleria lovaniensis]|uniref:Chromate transporter n=1 Tax=Naegleria lovaniensis TaxID=51637 RepID=A0AA88H339_NAELO|nr:uncharacterized protein C9374_012408 [Naegleria lovaniensis]KAG2392156.1 hypothetical protein C9374_012408 [Naegleria lovaniensis]